MAIDRGVNGAETPIRLLVVENDDVDRALLRSTLLRGGIDADVVEVGNAASMMQALGGGAFDCVIIDYLLPDTIGVEVLLELATWPERPPFVVVAALGDETVAVEVMRAGAIDYIPKALLTPERLARSVSYAVSLWNAERAARRAEIEREGYLGKLAALARILPSIQSTLSAETLVEVAAKGVVSILGQGHVFVGVDRGPGQDPVIARADCTRLPPEAEPDWLSLWHKIRGTRGSLRATRESHAELSTDPGSRIRALLALPILDSEERELGVIQVADERSGSLTETDSVILSQLGRTLGSALQVARLYRAAADAAHARDEVLAIVSHDLRSPLGSVLLAAAALREVDDPATIKNLSERIERSVRHMQRLIDDLLDVSHIDSGRLEVTVSEVAPEELLETALTVVAPLVTAANVRFVPRVEADLPLVCADRERIVQVLSNLLGNAVKYCPAETVIELSVQLEGDSVRFRIRDTGPGIAPEHLPHLFDRFWRPKQTKAGTGLGLYIAKGIVEAHSSELRVQSELGRGTTFEFSLHRVKRAESAAARPQTLPSVEATKQLARGESGA